MIREIKKLTNTYYNNSSLLDISLEDCVLFDIETTGLSSTKHMIYLIGYAYYEQNVWHIISLMATNLDDEGIIINDFLDFIKPKKHLIHFNGTTFDIPFIKSRSRFHKLDSISSYLDEINSIDLYKLAKKYSYFLNLENYKLKTIEQAIDINRDDIYNGKELISKYFEFIKLYSLDCIKKDFSNSNPLKEILLLHNYEDLVNMIPLLHLFHYAYLKEGHYTFNSYDINDNNLYINCSLRKGNTPYSLIKDVSLKLDDGVQTILLNFNKDTLLITIPITHEELKFFYPDYKNYYYLPLEDTAIHKSIGTYVDKEHRTQAKAATCYIKKVGSYIPTINNVSTLPLFKYGYEDKCNFLELNETFISNKNHIIEYIHNIINSVIK